MQRKEPHSPTLTSLHLSHSSFSIPSAALPTSQLILQPFRCFTYVIGTSPTSQHILQHFRRFTYVTAQSTVLPLLHLRHSSFSNPSAASSTPQIILQSSAASPTSQVILQPFRCFTTPQALHVFHLASRPCIGGWKNSLWWTSLLQQVTKFRSSYSFG